jgi:hypothetical protein
VFGFAPRGSRRAHEGLDAILGFFLLGRGLKDRTERLSGSTFFIVGQNAVLSELVTGQSEWGPGSRSRGSSLGQLVIDSKLSTADPYSYQVRSTSPDGSLPFFREKPGIVS